MAFYTLAERKVIGWMQVRRGPQYVGPLGLLQPFADVVKLLIKEIVVPKDANRFLFILNFQREAMRPRPNVLDPVAEAQRLRAAQAEIDSFPARFPSAQAPAAERMILEAREKGDSVGGAAEIVISGVPAPGTGCWVTGRTWGSGRVSIWQNSSHEASPRRALCRPQRTDHAAQRGMEPRLQRRAALTERGQHPGSRAMRSASRTVPSEFQGRKWLRPSSHSVRTQRAPLSRACM